MYLLEEKNSPYTFIYISREYYNGKCLDINRIGIGKSKDPITRLKKHNSSSSKISTQVKFELIYKTNLDDRFFHNILIKRGYKNVHKEIFEGTENKPLTIQEIKSIIEEYAIDGPWIIKNNLPIKLNDNIKRQTSKPNKIIPTKKNITTQNKKDYFNNGILIFILIFIFCIFIIIKNKITPQNTYQNITNQDDKIIINDWLSKLQNCSYYKTISQNKITIYFYIHNEIAFQEIKDTIFDNKQRFKNTNHEKIILDFPGRFYMSKNNTPINIQPIKEEIKF